MADVSDRVARFTADEVAAAATEGARQSGSAGARVEADVAGHLALGELAAERITAVALGENGDLVEYRPDSTEA